MDDKQTFPVDPLGTVPTSTLIEHLLARFAESNALDFVSNGHLLDLWSIARAEALHRDGTFEAEKVEKVERAAWTA